MDAPSRRALEECHDQIVRDLDVKFVITKLLENHVISREDWEDIDAWPETQAIRRCQKLLDILKSKCTRELFDKFVAILKDDYSWLANSLKEARGSKLSRSRTIDVQYYIRRGGIPSAPKYLVPRPSLTMEISSKLHGMRDQDFLVLHGMTGSGKSVLATEVARDSQMISECFPDGIFWVKVGEVDQESLLAKMQLLYEKLDHESSRTNVLLPSIEFARGRLQRVLENQGDIGRRPSTKKILLVLDDVWSAKVIHAFDIGCKVLVTTQDQSVINGAKDEGRAHFIQVTHGLTVEESKELLARWVQNGNSAEDLPQEAEDIHDLCRGSPMMLSLVGSMLADNQRSNKWMYMIDKLKQKKLSLVTKQRDYGHLTVNDAIAMSLENLKEDLQKKYQCLAVFMDDVCFSSESLAALWDMDPEEADEPGLILVRKSLLTREYDSRTDTHVYAIHDLQLNYLKSLIDEEELKQLHEKLVVWYLKKATEGNYMNVPHDNYFFWWVGHHIYCAKRYDLFPELYLNLSFVCAKIQATGPSDLLNDFEKYKEYLDSDPLMEGLNTVNHKKRLDIMEFVRTHSHELDEAYSDILQLALSEPAASHVRMEAEGLIDQRPQKLYLECMKAPKKPGLQLTRLHSETVQCALFLHDGSNILVGEASGIIRLWDAKSGVEQETFIGHANQPVTGLAITSDGSLFISTCEDGSAKVWKILDATKQQKRRSRTPSGNSLLYSPRLRPLSWAEHFLDEGKASEDRSIKTFSGHQSQRVLCCGLYDKTKLACTGAGDGFVKVWSYGDSPEVTSLPHRSKVKAVKFSSLGDVLAVGCEDSTIFLYEMINWNRVFSFKQHRMAIVDIHFLQGGQGIITVSENDIFKWSHLLELEEKDIENGNVSPNMDAVGRRESDSSAVPESLSRSRFIKKHSTGSRFRSHVQGVQVQLRNQSTNQLVYTCSSVSKSGKYLAVGTHAKDIIIWDVESQYITAFQKPHSSSVTVMHFSPNENYLLSSCGATLMIWDVSSFLSLEVAPLTSVFNARFKVTQPDQPVIAIAGRNSCLHVFSGMEGNKVCEGVKEDNLITCIQILEDCSWIAYGIEDGRVVLFSVRDKKPYRLYQHENDSSITSLAVGGGDRFIISADMNGRIKIFQRDRKSGHKGKLVQCQPHPNYMIDQMTILKYSTLLCALLRDGSIHFYSLDDGSQMYKLSMAKGGLTSIDVSTDEVHICGGAHYGHCVYVWAIPPDWVNGKKGCFHDPKVLYGPHNTIRVCRFSQQGHRIAASDKLGLIYVWNAKTGDLLTPSPLMLHSNLVRDLRFSMCGSFLVTVGEKIAWWDIWALLSTPIQAPSPSSEESFDGSIESSFRRMMNGFRSRMRIGNGIMGSSSTKECRCGSILHTKRGRRGKRELLQAMELSGNTANWVIASPDFNVFITVNESGMFYIFRAII
ncbi:unnamed protein product [Darwinula stevensoni]|uniref:CARD domain-containing protein n=1 Tax=Darwinula stevensoni TaxID=69355 RepID=A0A7R8XC19_9CRUS|nr:unnamed protein product [Darwinula stevensoni]CAG0887252.1 unnamed protein product [Darwinula stevensoni]